MTSVATDVYHCERCGTLKIVRSPDWFDTYAPKLVERCREFEKTLGFSWLRLWQRLGIAESIRTPENRSAT